MVTFGIVLGNFKLPIYHITLLNMYLNSLIERAASKNNVLQYASTEQRVITWAGVKQCHY